MLGAARLQAVLGQEKAKPLPLVGLGGFVVSAILRLCAILGKPDPLLHLAPLPAPALSHNSHYGKRFQVLAKSKGGTWAALRLSTSQRQ